MRRIQPFVSLVDRQDECCELTNQSFSTFVGHDFYFIFLSGKIPSSCGCTGIRIHVPTSDGFEVTK